MPRRMNDDTLISMPDNLEEEEAPPNMETILQQSEQGRLHIAFFRTIQHLMWFLNMGGSFATKTSESKYMCKDMEIGFLYRYFGLNIRRKTEMRDKMEISKVVITFRNFYFKYGTYDHYLDFLKYLYVVPRFRPILDHPMLQCFMRLMKTNMETNAFERLNLSIVRAAIDAIFIGIILLSTMNSALAQDISLLLYSIFSLALFISSDTLLIYWKAKEIHYDWRTINSCYRQLCVSNTFLLVCVPLIFVLIICNHVLDRFSYVSEYIPIGFAYIVYFVVCVIRLLRALLRYKVVKCFKYKTSTTLKTTLYRLAGLYLSNTDLVKYLRKRKWVYDKQYPNTSLPMYKELKFYDKGALYATDFDGVETTFEDFVDKDLANSMFDILQYRLEHSV